MKIACLGDNCIDYYDETGEVFFGGNPVNIAVYLRRIGELSSYLGAVGTDVFGEKMLRALAAKGVDVSHVQVREGATALTHVTLRGGERVLGDYEEGVMAEYSLTHEDFSFIGEHRLAVTGLWGHCEDALEQIRAMGVLTAFDCADRPEDPAACTAVPHTDILFFSDSGSSEEELKEKLATLHARQIDGARCAKPGQAGTAVTVATRGAKGSLAFDGSEYCSFGIIPCRVVDTMGAGDSYIAGFLAAYLRGGNLRACMEAGARCSAETLGYAGAW